MTDSTPATAARCRCLSAVRQCENEATGNDDLCDFCRGNDCYGAVSWGD